jgi:PhzF family phenazine biosynthesis protein
MNRTMFVIDAFTSRQFGGNPAAVVLMPHGDALQDDTDTCQKIAKELNLSETAFVSLPENFEDKASADQVFGLRWFTPVREVDLCGHATLASAHALYDAGLVSLHHPLEFSSRSGLLRASPDHDWQGFWLDFPATPPDEQSPPDHLLSALGLSSVCFSGRSRPPDGYDDQSVNDYFDWFLEVESANLVRNLSPDFEALLQLTKHDPHSRGVIVSAKAAEGEEPDVVSRCFYPSYGIDEDPATGSAHCTIGPYFARTLGRGSDTILCHQVSDRLGELHVRHLDTRVHLGGQAVSVLRGKLLV